MFLISLLLVGAPPAAVAPHVPQITVAPGVDLPMVALGTGSGQKGNVSDAVQLWLKALGTTADREAAETGNCTWLRIAGSPPSASRGEMNANSASLAISSNLGIN